MLAWYARHRRKLPWRATAGRNARPLRGLALGDHAPADDGRGGETLLRGLPRPLADDRRVGGGAGRRSDASLGRARLLCARPQSPCLRRRRRAPSRRLVFRRARRNSGRCRASAPIRQPPSPPSPSASGAVVIDGNVERVVARLFAIGEPMPAAKPRIRAAAERLTPAEQCGDFAQAMMDLGATICTPKRPACALCPLAEFCRAHAAAAAGRLSGQGAEAGAAVAHRRRFLYPPRRRPCPGAHARSPRPSRRHDRNPRHRLERTKGTVRRRRAAAAAGAPASPARPGRPCLHPFRAEPLRPSWERRRPDADAPPGFRFVSPTALDAEALPSLMRKVVAHVRAFGEVSHPRTDRDRTSPASPHRHRKRRKRPAPTAPS